MDGTPNSGSFPTYLYYVIGGGALLILLCVILFVVLKNKKKTPKLKIDNEFIDNIVTYLGSINNIVQVNVDNGRLKIEVSDTDCVKFEEIKALASNGIFITGNTIKILFKYDSDTIKKALDSKLKIK